MRKIKVITIAATFWVIVTGFAFAKEIYPFDLVKKQPYKAIWGQEVWREARDKNDDWLKGAEGVATPLESVIISSQKYQRATVCEPHNCSDNIIYFLIKKPRFLLALIFTVLLSRFPSRHSRRHNYRLVLSVPRLSHLFHVDNLVLQYAAENGENFLPL